MCWYESVNSDEKILEDGTYQAKIEFPGVEKEQILPKREGKYLKIRIGKNETRFSEAEYVITRSFESFDLDKAEFKLGLGILTVTIPRKENYYKTFSVE